MNDVKLEIEAQEKASRVEWLVRFFYLIPLYIVLMALGMIAFIGITVNFFTSIILGKRIAAINKFVTLYISYYAKMMAYMYLTDERPPIIPEEK